jgi:hypothetical protein
MLAGAPERSPSTHTSRVTRPRVELLRDHRRAPPYWVGSNVTVGIDVAMPAQYAREVWTAIRPSVPAGGKPAAATTT